MATITCIINNLSSLQFGKFSLIFKGPKTFYSIDNNYVEENDFNQYLERLSHLNSLYVNRKQHAIFTTT